jgi:hypothetical protein
MDGNMEVIISREKKWGIGRVMQKGRDSDEGFENVFAYLSVCLTG